MYANFIQKVVCPAIQAGIKEELDANVELESVCRWLGSEYSRSEEVERSTTPKAKTASKSKTASKGKKTKSSKNEYDEKELAKRPTKCCYRFIRGDKKGDMCDEDRIRPEIPFCKGCSDKTKPRAHLASKGLTVPSGARKSATGRKSKSKQTGSSRYKRLEDFQLIELTAADETFIGLHQLEGTSLTVQDDKLYGYIESDDKMVEVADFDEVHFEEYVKSKLDPEYLPDTIRVSFQSFVANKEMPGSNSRIPGLAKKNIALPGSKSKGGEPPELAKLPKATRPTKPSKKKVEEEEDAEEDEAVDEDGSDEE